MHELAVCVDLMRRGFEVFRCVSPNSRCDLVAINGGNFIKVEVTSGTLSKKGMVSFPPRKLHSFDLLAIVVVGSMKIIYSTDQKIQNQSPENTPDAMLLLDTAKHPSESFLPAPTG